MFLVASMPIHYTTTFAPKHMSLSVSNSVD